ncbi:MAG: hypothetical protein ACXWLM_03445 [Myxococcales bacterium]
MTGEIKTACPHCGGRLQEFALPEAVFDHASDFACFNDECPYFVRGWVWMEEQYGVHASYRYRVDSRSGYASPLAVHTPSAFRSSIISEREEP